jgi:hypothetical protein
VKRYEWMCLDCRSALDLAVCDASLDHRVVYAMNGDGRTRLREEVWGPRELRERAVQLAKAGGSGAGLFVAFQTFGDCGNAVFGGYAWLISICAGLVFGVVWWAVTAIAAAVRRRRFRVLPRGGATTLLLPPALRDRREPLIGRVIDGDEVSSPSGARCFAYCVELRKGGAVASQTMLQHAETAGLVIALDDGSRVEVPAGRIRLTGVGEHKKLDRQLLASRVPFLDDSDPNDLPPVPFDAALETILCEGDRLEVHGELSREAVDDAPSDYRHGPAIVSRPVGVVALRKISCALSDACASSPVKL